MQYKAFSVKDLKGAYSAPFFAPSVGDGERVFMKLARDPQTNIQQFAEDFELYLVGSFDDDSCEYTAQKPQQLMRAVDAKLRQ